MAAEENGKKDKLNNAKKTRVIPGYHLTLGIVIAMLSLIVLIPLASVLVSSLKLSPGEFWHLLLKKNVLNAFKTSIGCSFIAAIVNTVFGLIIAWTLVKYDFPGKKILDGFIELPFCLPTAVAGITLSRLYSEDGFLGKPLAALGIDVAYTKIGLTIALVFVGIPFVIRAVQPILEKMDNQYEEAAYMLGATPRRTFFKVILPELRPALLTGFGLAFARGIGEYGSVIYISGNSAKEQTQVISYVIMQKLSYIDYASATAINTFFGICAAWLLTKFSFKGKQVLATLIDIPFSISPVIVGLAYLMTFGRLGWTYPAIRWINDMLGTNIRITFAVPGVVLATIFVTFPFVSRELIPVLNAQGKDEEEAAALMGAKGFTIFRRITLPQMKWGLIYGIILCTARALGEFGAVNALSKTRGGTFTLPLEIDALYMSGTEESITAAFAVSSILVIIAVIILFLRNLLEYRAKRKRAYERSS